MGILNLFKRKNKTKKYSDDDYVKSSFIYHDSLGNNIIILLSFTENYFSDAIELLSATKLNTKFIQTSIDIESEELDEDGNNKTISKNINYLLIGGSSKEFVNMFKHIETISNNILGSIIDELYEHSHSDYFTDLIDDGILNKSLFKNKKSLSNDIVGNYIYDDISKWLKLLPKEFYAYDLIPFIRITNKFTRDSFTGDEFISYLRFEESKDNVTNEELEAIFGSVIKHPTRENLIKLNEPLYKRSLDEDELLNGEIDSVELDELFTQQYDRFNAIVDDSVNYVDIDEKLSEDDPEYNDLLEEDNNEY